MDYKIIIGLEVHVQLLTKTKLFCGCSTKFGLPPNSATCPICIGMPGVLPVMNRRAFDLAVRAALALNCTIADFTKWDRKNYYYPDLPKNYQISQYDLPFSEEGWLEITSPAGGKKRVGIIRVHLEEDAGKMLHDEKGGGSDSLVDLNRAGTPLCEIVSKPDMNSPEEAKAYLEELKLLLLELGISDCEMQEGSLRCDANVNIHVPQPDGSFVATPIVEVKNMNSFGGVQRAMKYMAEEHYREYQEKMGRQWEILPRSGEKGSGPVVHKVGERRNGQLRGVPKATYGWNDLKGIAIMQRRKEEASDYRYFPEPDLVPVVVEAPWREKVRSDLGELPAARRERLQSQHALSAYDAGVITAQGRPFGAYFEKVASLCGDPKEASNWITNQVLATLNETKQDITQFRISAEGLAELIKEKQSRGLPAQRAREVYADMLEHGKSAPQAIKDRGFDSVVDDPEKVREIIRRAMAANQKAVEDFKKGKVKAADAIKGAVMRETKGKVRTDLVQQILTEELARA